MKAASTSVIDAQLRLILRGAIGGTAEPTIEVTFLDTDVANNPVDADGVPVTDLDLQAAVDISAHVKRLELSLEREDRRTDIALLMPPAGTLTLTLGNSRKLFTPQADNQFSDKVALGRVFRIKLGYKVNGAAELLDMGDFIADEPSFDVVPGSIASVTCRDKVGGLLQQEISVANLGPIDAGDYILEVLKRVGLQESDFETAAGLPTFSTTPAFQKKKAIDILSEVLVRLQLEGQYRLVQIGRKLKLTLIPTTGNAGVVFNWTRDIGKRFSRRDRMNQARRRTTTKSADAPGATNDTVAATASGTEADLPVTIPFATSDPWIRVVWIQPGSETLRLVETSRNTDELVLDRRNPVATGSWSVQVRGDRVTDGSRVGESGSGTLLDLKRGKTEEFLNRFMASSAEAQELAEVLQDTLGQPFREVEFDLPNAWVLGEINDLFRVLEKYSGDRDIYHISKMHFQYVAENVRLKCSILGQFSGIEEADQTYDNAFGYDDGRIYDERFPIGENDSEERTLTGAVVVRSR